MAFDHILLIGFGGPRAPEEIRPFLEEVTRGLPMPPARLDEVARHYEQTGGRSMYNEHTFRLARVLTDALRDADVTLPVFVGMRCWHPFLHDTLREIQERQLRRGLGLILATHRSEPSYGRYTKSLEQAKEHAGAQAISYDYVDSWHDHPLFIQAQAALVRAVLEPLSASERATTHLLFTAHAIPADAAKRSRYAVEFRWSSTLVTEALQHAVWSIAYQSRSGHPREPWLEPDVLSAIRGLPSTGARQVVLVPIGFVSDHTEVVYDLDVQARATAGQAGLRYLRASTVMDHPDFVAALVALIRRQLRAGD